MTMVTSLFLSDFLYNCCLGGLVSSFTQLFPELVGDGLHHLVGHLGRNRDFQFDLRHEVHGVFGATVNFGMARLRAEPLDFRHHHAAHARGGQRFANLVELERFDCCNDQFHGLPLVVTLRRFELRPNRLRTIQTACCRCSNDSGGVK